MFRYWKLIAVAALVLLAMVGGGLYGYLTKSPLYSLWQARQAFRQHRLSDFDKYVDVETMAGRMIDQMTAANSAAAQRSGDLWEQFVQMTARNLAPMVKPRLVSRLKEQVAAYVLTGRFAVEQNGSEQEFFTLRHLYQMAGGDDVELKGIVFVRTEPSYAIVGLRLQHKVYHAPMLLELVLQKRGGYWRVVAFNNLPDYMKAITQLEAKHGKNAP